jgi:hypothetical protein
VSAVSNRVPRWYVKVDRARDESAIGDEVPNVLVLGPVDLPKQRKVGELETLHLRHISH